MKKEIQILVVVFFAAVVAPTYAVSIPMAFSFSQDGWLDGITNPAEGALTGMFEGEDNVVVDGVLSFADGEISAFMAEWSGNRHVFPTNWGLGDLSAFEYVLGSGSIPPGQVVTNFNADGVFWQSSSVLTFGEFVGFVGITDPLWTGTREPVIVTPRTNGVPDGGFTLSLLLLGVTGSFGMAARLRRKMS